MKNLNALLLSSGFFIATYIFIKLIFGEPQDYIMGRQVPNFELAEVTSKEKIFRSEDLKGEGYKILNFFASWCGMCKVEHSFLMSLKSKYGIKVYGIDYMDAREKAVKLLEEKGNPYVKAGFDPQGKMAEVFYIVGTPTSFLISPDGKLLKVIRGPLTQEVFEREIQPVIGEAR